ncbi:MAG: GNAT family N-acetyltransferase [Hyphomicrobiaceae bacterium]|nr:GNAT family N-acetyltransferase [Hyphomicrobiaceae bacterium]
MIIMTSPEEIRTRLPDPIVADRLVLRRPRRDDATALQRLANNFAVHKMLARLPHPYTMEHAHDFIDNICRSAADHGYAITRDDAFVGVIGFHFGTAADRDRLEIGYWLGEPYWGKGYASEAAVALISALHVIDPGVRLVARALADNPASRRVLEKSGFTLTSETTGDCGQHAGQLIRYFEWQGGGHNERT